jgi:hypothetical protein
MNREKIIEAFSFLGEFMSQFQSFETKKKNLVLNEEFYEAFSSAIYAAKIRNGWFEEKQVRRSVMAISEWLTQDVLNRWTSEYQYSTNSKRVAIIMAGNIPLVGFHDFVCVLLSGNKVLVKLSSDDKVLLPLLAKVLIRLDKGFKESIQFTDARLENFDVVIATGSDNTARYFDHYFGKYPHIIRRNRNSIAVLSGNESKEDLVALGDDIFAYYGLGCRNVSKVYVPKGYNFNLMFEALYEYHDVFDNKKYANNFDYYRALFLMGGNEMLENGFLLLREDDSLASPISMLHHEAYESVDALKLDLESKKDQIQCIVSSLNISNSFKLGQAQCPAVNDYADGVDTMAFLTNL